ncbi:pyrimidine reductase family protein [Prauserella alba]|uniref:Pyrimidine reductase family protein n=1 Tax=Prauserella alba TaxID=176898 RepID=A0ABP4G456_9PSEU|nr:Pyrimidine reductase, riboflavin biosynthesis [Prauserella alba]
MHQLWPLPTASRPDTASDPGAASGPDTGPAAAPELSDEDLEALYGYPADLDRPWVQANFVTSADGAVSVDERSEGLSSPADKRVFLLGRDLADVVLVGAGTALAENYRGARTNETRRARRRRHGLSDVPPIAVVTRRCSIPPDSPVITDTAVPTIVITAADAPADRREALTDAGAEVLLAGEDTVDPAAAIRLLGDRGLRRIDCEGGPHLLASLVAADLVDQLCLTYAPLLAGPGPGRIVAGLPATPRDMALQSLLHDDGFLLARYRRA